MHEPGPAEIHAAINVDTVPTCIYPGAIYLSGWAAEHETDGGMTMYQSSPAEDAQKAAGGQFPPLLLHIPTTPPIPLPLLFPHSRITTSLQHIVSSNIP